MLIRRTAPRACRCASTSLAPPCRHSHSSNSANSSFAQSTSTASTEPARKWFSPARHGWAGWPTSYNSPTATSSSATSPTSSLSYPPFNPALFSPDLALPSCSSPISPPPLLGLSSSSTSSSLGLEALNKTALARLAPYLHLRSHPEASSAHPVFEDEYGALLATGQGGEAAAEEQDMPLLHAMVQEDLQAMRVKMRRKREIELGRHTEGQAVEAEPEEEAEMVAAVEAEEVVAAREEHEVEAVAAEEEPAAPVEESSFSPTEEAAGEPTPAPAPEPVQLSNAQSTSLLRRLVSQPRSALPPSQLSDFEGTDEERLTALWDAFVAAPETDLEGHPAELQLALEFLHYLVAPFPPSPLASASAAPAPHLALSLRILQSLLEFLPDSVVAAQPSSPSTSSTPVPQSAQLQSVLLRTLSNIALSESAEAEPANEKEALHALSARALLSLSHLLALHPSLSPATTVAEEAPRVSSTLTGLIAALSDARAASYAPSLARAARAPSAPVQLAAELLLSPSLFAIAPTRTLDKLVPELAARERWDLLAALWARWAAPPMAAAAAAVKGEAASGVEGERWTLPGFRFELARWLAGEAAARTYAPSSSASTSAAAAAAQGGKARPLPVRGALFARLAEETHALLRSGVVGAGQGGKRPWRLERKNDWVKMLVSSAAATVQTRSLARRIVGYWQEQQKRGGEAFHLSAPNLLALVRTSLPPYSHSRAFAEQLVATHVGHLVAPSSPFARRARFPANPRLGGMHHFDLTALAHAYALLGDWASVGQVYLRLLEARILPDAKDIELLLSVMPARLSAAAAATAAAEGGTEKEKEKDVPAPQQQQDPVKTARGVVAVFAAARQAGVKLDERTFQLVLRSLLSSLPGVKPSAHRAEHDQARRTVEGVVEVVFEAARDAGLGQKALNGLRKTVEECVAAAPVRYSAKEAPSTLPRLAARLARSPSSASKSGGLEPKPQPVEARTALALLSHAHKSLDFSLSLRTFLPLFRHSLLPDSSAALGLFLRTGLDGVDRDGRAKGAAGAGRRERIRRGMGEGLRAVLESEEGRRLLGERETLDLALRAAMRVEGPGAPPSAIDADDANGPPSLVELVGRAASLLASPAFPSPAVAEQVARWAVARYGRSRVMDPLDGAVGSGWVGRTAREMKRAKGREE
ncbi:hypothetical protein JCM8097_002374 [Rhodosporidiobolus ruineniae]